MIEVITLQMRLGKVRGGDFSKGNPSSTAQTVNVLRISPRAEVEASPLKVEREEDGDPQEAARGDDHA